MSRMPNAVSSIDIRQYGFVAPTDKDFKPLDDEIQRTHDFADLQRNDFHVKVTLLSPNTLVVYRTRGPAGELRSNTLSMEALFFDCQTGKLKHRESWPVRRRNRMTDFQETEGRIFAVDADHFLVHANNRLLLYGSRFVLLKELALDELAMGPSTSATWAVQVAVGGKRLFLRTEILGTYGYQWRDAYTLASVDVVPAPPPLDIAADHPVLPRETGYYIQQQRNLQPYPPDSGATISCEPNECRSQGISGLPLSEGRVLISSKQRAAVYTSEGQLIWHRETDANTGLRMIGRSLNGRTFVTVWKGSQGEFDGVSLSNEDPTAFVYDLESGKRRLTATVPMGWDYGFSLSPDGMLFTILHGTTVDTFQCNRP